MTRALSRIDALVAAGLVAAEDAPALEAVTARYALAISPGMASRIDPADPADPIAAQFVPHAGELETLPEERPDPIGDFAHSPVKGLVHRYPDRVLIKLTHACPVYCRFCFRREMVGPGGDGTLSDAEFGDALAYLSAHPEIGEVILTGGDPLILPARRIAAIGTALADLPQRPLLRWHSRVPVVSPERITPALAAALAAPATAVAVSIHANHAREFSAEAEAGLARLARAGIVLLGQTVLLKGVNAETGALAELFRTMARNRIRPVYLHHPDLAPGTARFRLPIAEGQAIHAGLRGRLPGWAIPTYVLDLPGGHGKVDIGEHRVRAGAESGLEFRDRSGTWRAYP